jgi:hypothetical protein
MKYYVCEKTNVVYAFEDDGSQDFLINDAMRMLEDYEIDKLRVPEHDKCATEDGWVKSEMEVVADQLLKIEDGDPSALPGTTRQWRDYRIDLRAWKVGAAGFPEIEARPVRPDSTARL